MKNLFLLILTIAVLSCNKESSFIPTEPSQNNNEPSGEVLKILWERPLHPDTIGSISTEPVYLNGKVFFTLWPEWATDSEILCAFDAEDGLIIWEKESSTGKSGTKMSLLNYQDNILYRTDHALCLLNETNGEEKWCHFPAEEGSLASSQVKIIDNEYYRSYYDQPLGNRTQSELVRGNLETGELETIFTVHKTEEFIPTIKPPARWINENDEKILFFQNSLYEWATVNGYSTLYMYNVNTKEVEYIWDNLYGGGTNNYGPYIQNDKLFVQGTDTIRCIDIHSKDVVWKKWTGQAGTNSFIRKDILVIKANDGRMMGLNPLTGETIWEVSDSGYTPSSLTYFDGIVYFGSLGSGKLYAVDIETGEHIWAEDPPNQKKGYPNASFLNGVAIDTVNRVLFTDDEHFVMAIQLPER